MVMENIKIINKEDNKDRYKIILGTALNDFHLLVITIFE